MDGHVIDLIPEYALGSLEKDEIVQVEDHLRFCAACREELAAYNAVLDEFPFAVPEVMPPASLKSDIMKRARPARPKPGSTFGDFWGRLRDSLYRSAPAWGMLSLFLVVVLAVSNVMLWQRLSEFEGVSKSSLITVDLSGIGASAHASGKLIMSADGEYGTLIVDGLPQLPAEYQYQLWLIRDGMRTSGGVFSVNDTGYANLSIDASTPINSYNAYGVTVEPYGGSPSPVGKKVLGGQL